MGQNDQLDDALEKLDILDMEFERVERVLKRA